MLIYVDLFEASDYFIWTLCEYFYSYMQKLQLYCIDVSSSIYDLQIVHIP
jgi:hypothetical protein